MAHPDPAPAEVALVFRKHLGARTGGATPDLVHLMRAAEDTYNEACGTLTRADVRDPASREHTPFRQDYPSRGRTPACRALLELAWVGVQIMDSEEHRLFSESWGITQEKV